LGTVTAICQKKCCKLLPYSTLLFVETSASWYNSYPEPNYKYYILPCFKLFVNHLFIGVLKFSKMMQR
jgi:hypothetical protein